MDWLIKCRKYQPFMTDIISLSIYGFGSIDSLLNLKIYEIHSIKTIMKDPDVKEAFKIVKLHNFSE